MTYVSAAFLFPSKEVKALYFWLGEFFFADSGRLLHFCFNFSQSREFLVVFGAEVSLELFEIEEN